MRQLAAVSEAVMSKLHWLPMRYVFTAGKAPSCCAALCKLGSAGAHLCASAWALLGHCCARLAAARSSMASRLP